jgi:uncharacterized protein (TIGR02145 family)
MKKNVEILSLFLLSMLISSCKKENKPPVINNIQFNPTEIITNSAVILTAAATDPEGDNLSYTWNCPKGTFTSTTGQSVNWTSPADAGTYVITVTVSDGKNTVSQTSNIVVLSAIGSLTVNSTPSDANIFIDGIDTKKVTPSNFNNLTLGIKIISVAKTGYLSIKDTIAANIQYKKTSTVSFTLVAKANISGYVYYAGTKIPVSGVTVSINSKTITTGTSGSYSLTEIASGSTNLNATKPDYDPFTKSITLNAGNNSLNIEMTSGIYTNTISGTVKTSLGTIIPGVSVFLLNEDGTSTNIHDQTDASGKYQLPAVPQGQRKLSFIINSFNNSQKDIFVSNANRIFDVVLLAKLITPIDPSLGMCTTSINQIKWSSSYGPELLGFNIYRSKNPSSNFIKINSTLITLNSNPPSNGFIFYNDPVDNSLTPSYYKISVINVDSYEGPLSTYILVNTFYFINTSTVSDLSITSATLGGSITGDGGSTITERGIYWSTSQNPELTGTKLQIGSGVGLFSTYLTGLIPNTDYYVKAFASNNLGPIFGSQVHFKTYGPGNSPPIIFNSNLTYGSVIDVDGNSYKTIQIGNQIWMAENLRTKTYNDRSSIPLVTDAKEYGALESPCYCWYNNDLATNGSIFGALYNFYTVNTGKLCPSGWHVPSDPDWTTLITFLGGNNGVADKLRETGPTHWGIRNGGSNSSGFTALPGGDRRLIDQNGTYIGIYEALSSQGNWWSTSTDFYGDYYVFTINYYDNYITKWAMWPSEAYSVRCLKDN